MNAMLKNILIAAAGSIVGAIVTAQLVKRGVL